MASPLDVDVRRSENQERPRRSSARTRPASRSPHPGERLSTDVVEYLEQLTASGVMVEGAADETLETFRVVAR